MIKLENYLQDGANYQARAVLMLLQGVANIEESWNGEKNRYEAEIKLSRWENCREQGYIVSLRNKKNEQVNISFFNHRILDTICAIQWVHEDIDTLPYLDVDHKTYNTGHGDAYEMAGWIFKQLREHWIK